MSAKARLDTAAPTDELPVSTPCACADDEHRWSAPVIETVDTVRITRWRCTCPRCQCDGLSLVVDPTDTGTPQHLAVDTDEKPSGFLHRVIAGLDRL